MRGAFMEAIGFGGSYLLRLISTLVLTRLLFPELFGLASIVSILLFGLNMLSDTGIAQGAVRSKRGDDVHYLNTAWTFGLVRGFLLWAIACVLAWPLSVLYDEQQLVELILVGSFSVVISGFTSTSLISLRRHLSLGRLAIIELSTQSLALGVTVIWAYISPTVWSIIGGNLTAVLFKACVSHLVSVGYRNRLEWDISHARAIFDFGKWILGSSALMFIGLQADRLILGSLAGMATLGIYYIATTLSDAAGALAGRITTGVLYPALSRVARENPDRVREAYYKARLRTDVIGLVPLGIVFTIAQLAIDILYDERYESAGWMLQILCLRVALGITLETMKDCLMVLGHVQSALHQSLTRAVIMPIGVPIGWYLFGIEGIVWAAVIAELGVAIVMILAFARRGLLLPLREAYAICLFCLGICFGYVAEISITSLVEVFDVSI